MLTNHYTIQSVLIILVVLDVIALLCLVKSFATQGQKYMWHPVRFELTNNGLQAYYLLTNHYTIQSVLIILVVLDVIALLWLVKSFATQGQKYMWHPVRFELLNNGQQA